MGKAIESLAELADIKTFEHLPHEYDNLALFFARILLDIGYYIDGRHYINDSFNQRTTDLSLSRMRKIFIGFTGIAGAGKKFSEETFLDWNEQLDASFEVTHVGWITHGEDRGRAAGLIKSPRVKKLTPNELVIGNQMMVLSAEESLNSYPIVLGTFPNSAVRVNGRIIGRPVGFVAMEYIAKKNPPLDNIENGFSPKMVGMSPGFYVPNYLVYERDDLAEIDPSTDDALEKAARVRLNYGKRPPKDILELIKWQNRGAPPELVHSIDNDVCESLADRALTGPDGVLILPDYLDFIRDYSQTELTILLKTVYRLKTIVRGSSLYYMIFNNFGLGIDDMFIADNDPQPHKAGFDVTAIESHPRRAHLKERRLRYEDERGLFEHNPDADKLKSYFKKILSQA